MPSLRRTLIAALTTAAAVVSAAAPALAQHYPGVTTGPPVEVGWESATISFSVIPTLIDSTVVIQYGTTPARGLESAPYAVVTGDQPTNATIELTGLTPQTTYHYRALAKNIGGLRSYGEMLTFTTTAVPPPPAPRREPGGGGGGGGSTGGGGRAGAPAAPACTARGARAVAAGSATLTLGRAFIATLTGAGQRLAAVRPATLAGRAWRLPLSGGALDARLRAGRLCADGGLTLAPSRRTRRSSPVGLSALTVQVAARRPQLSARVGSRTVALAGLSPVALAGSGRARSAARVRATLTAAGASALRGALRTRAPRAGATLGTLALRLTLR